MMKNMQKLKNKGSKSQKLSFFREFPVFEGLNLHI